MKKIILMLLGVCILQGILTADPGLYDNIQEITDTDIYDNYSEKHKDADVVYDNVWKEKNYLPDMLYSVSGVTLIGAGICTALFVNTISNQDSAANSYQYARTANDAAQTYNRYLNYRNQTFIWLTSALAAYGISLGLFAWGVEESLKDPSAGGGKIDFALSPTMSVNNVGLSFSISY